MHALTPEVAFLFIFRKTKDIFDFLFKTRAFLSEIYLTLLSGEMMSCLLTSDWLVAIQWPFKGFLGIQVTKPQIPVATPGKTAREGMKQR